MKAVLSEAAKDCLKANPQAFIKAALNAAKGCPQKITGVSGKTYTIRKVK